MTFTPLHGTGRRTAFAEQNGLLRTNMTATTNFHSYPDQRGGSRFVVRHVEQTGGRQAAYTRTHTHTFLFPTAHTPCHQRTYYLPLPPPSPPTYYPTWLPPPPPHYLRLRFGLRTRWWLRFASCWRTNHPGLTFLSFPNYYSLSSVL